MIKIGIYPGTFDPLTTGHMDIVKRSLKIRTNLDKKRKNSPLIKVKDAILVRSDQLNKQQVLNKMSKAIDRALGN